jgi:hypothetical protein
LAGEPPEDFSKLLQQRRPLLQARRVLRGATPTLSPSTDCPGSPVIRLPCSADFATGRGGLLQLLCVSLPSCCRSHPARVATPLRSVCDAPCRLRPTVAGSAPGLALSRPPLRLLSLRPDDLPPRAFAGVWSRRLLRVRI